MFPRVLSAFTASVHQSCWPQLQAAHEAVMLHGQPSRSTSSLVLPPSLSAAHANSWRAAMIEVNNLLLEGVLQARLGGGVAGAHNLLHGGLLQVGQEGRGRACQQAIMEWGMEVWHMPFLMNLAFPAKQLLGDGRLHWLVGLESCGWPRSVIRANVPACTLPRSRGP